MIQISDQAHKNSNPFWTHIKFKLLLIWGSRLIHITWVKTPQSQSGTYEPSWVTWSTIYYFGQCQKILTRHIEKPNPYWIHIIFNLFLPPGSWLLCITWVKTPHSQSGTYKPWWVTWFSVYYFGQCHKISIRHIKTVDSNSDKFTIHDIYFFLTRIQNQHLNQSISLSVDYMWNSSDSYMGQDISLPCGSPWPPNLMSSFQVRNKVK